MARKDLMNGLMNSPEVSSDSDARVDASKPRYSTGAIGAVSRSIEDLKRRAIVDVDPRMVDDAGLRDRLDRDDAELAGLIQSIRDHGQQVPVLLRFNPNYEGRYQVVYGRRRVAALKALGQPVKALIRNLDDKALVLAQGQENTARKELSFIEKANFARQMEEARYDRKAMCDALSLDKTVISRMLEVAKSVPLPLIEAIGAAPRAGRGRWMELAKGLEGRDLVKAAVGDTSDARFEAVMAALTPPKRPARPAPVIDKVAATDGTPLAEVTRRGNATTVKLPTKTSRGFDQWLIDHLPEIHRNWKNQTGE
ncbi:plasmid partitioning protein RepB [Pseudosulfitobacter sp. DSM 107133]|jgi:ParB family chromosome partitioning protein|uniref:plasmid partitioning protein RepB n=1 Tax=Pseudosulfitobacter sp. DSM 107133 TaxID=2883100 RepID=UPI000DF37205|nr:plasmid partitioning protein RepB [Pseudosulfitobacter sp. DSM 107133]UOA28884.1 plasmid partitioning protein RepB-3 [Pseudosulfitobacter sp. DSM 107133]